MQIKAGIQQRDWPINIQWGLPGPTDMCRIHEFKHFHHKRRNLPNHLIGVERDPLLVEGTRFKLKMVRMLRTHYVVHRPQDEQFSQEHNIWSCCLLASLVERALMVRTKAVTKCSALDLNARWDGCHWQPVRNIHYTANAGALKVLREK